MFFALQKGILDAYHSGTGRIFTGSNCYRNPFNYPYNFQDDAILFAMDTCKESMKWIHTLKVYRHASDRKLTLINWSCCSLRN